MESELARSRQLGREAFERRDYATALEQFRSVLAEHPGFADIRHEAGLCLAFMGRPDEALAEFDAALKTNPGYVEAHINRALVLQDLGRYDDARLAFERAKELEQPVNGAFPAAATARLANALAAVGDIYMDAAAPDEASAQYARALELRPMFHDIRNKYATALLNMGRTAEALEELKRVLEWHPHFLAARLNLGLALYREGRTGDAAAEWEVCRQQQPQNPQVRAYLAMIERTDADPADS